MARTHVKIKIEKLKVLSQLRKLIFQFHRYICNDEKEKECSFNTAHRFDQSDGAIDHCSPIFLSTYLMIG